MREGRPEIVVFGLTCPNLRNTLLIGQISTNYHITMNMAMFDKGLLKTMIIKFSSRKTGKMTLRGWSTRNSSRSLSNLSNVKARLKTILLLVFLGLRRVLLPSLMILATLVLS
jgi:hypothetical protein